MSEQNPPADDVREALARAIWDCDGDLESAVLEDCRGMADAILSDPRFEVRLRGTVNEPSRALADPRGGCACTPHWQDAGAGYTEFVPEYEPDCPEHSYHLYDPRKGEWIFDPRGTVTDASEQVAWAVYGRATGNIKWLTSDEENAQESAEFYDVKPLYLGGEARS